jgi:hypothetical protein
VRGVHRAIQRSTTVRNTQSLRKLETRLIELETDPDLQLLLLALLDNWRFGTTLSTSLPPYLCLLLQAQQRVGGHRLLEGWLVPEWGSLQQRFYTRIGSKQTGKRWLIAVIRKLWDTTWDLWDHRNQVLHEQELHLTQAMSRGLHRLVIETYTASRVRILPRKDAYLVKFPLVDLLKKEDEVKQAWLQGAQLALAAMSADSNSLRGMRQCLRRWLRRSAFGS